MMAMAEDVGAEVVLWPIDETGHLQVEALEEILAEGGVAWVAVTGSLSSGRTTY